MYYVLEAEPGISRVCTDTFIWMTHKWQNWKVYSLHITVKNDIRITIFVNLWIFGQIRENMIFWDILNKEQRTCHPYQNSFYCLTLLVVENHFRVLIKVSVHDPWAKCTQMWPKNKYLQWNKTYMILFSTFQLIILCNVTTLHNTPHCGGIHTNW